MASITVNLPSQTLSAHRSPAELEREVQLAAAIYWYARGELSQQRAAEAAGLNRTDFLYACDQAGVNVFQSDADEFLNSSSDRHG